MAAFTGRGSRLLALLLGMLLAIPIGEVVLRVVRPPQLAIVRYPCIYRPDPVTGFRYVQGASGRVAAHFEIDQHVEINAQGFYDDPPEPAGAAPRVLAVGDSFTAAMNVPVDRVWTSVLERALREGGAPRADVVNLGLDGTGTDVHAALLEAYVPLLTPDVIVLAFYANDVADVVHGRFTRECHRGYVLSYQTPEQRDALRARVDAHLARPVRRWLHEHVYGVRLLAAAVLPRQSPYRMEFLQPTLAELGPGARDARAGARRFRDAVARLERVARSCGCRLVVAPVPPRSDPQGSLDVWRRAAAGSPLEVADVLPALARARAARGLEHADLYFEHDLHLNAVGNALYGEALAQALSASPPR